MPKTPPNHGKPWTAADDRTLDKLIQQYTPTGLMAYELGRTEDAVRSYASDTDRSLKPVNQSPYNRRKKG
jgi:hypothetical protein